MSVVYTQCHFCKRDITADDELWYFRYYVDYGEYKDIGEVDFCKYCGPYVKRARKLDES